MSNKLTQFGLVAGAILLTNCLITTCYAQHLNHPVVSPSDNDANWQHQVPLRDAPSMEHHHADTEATWAGDAHQEHAVHDHHVMHDHEAHEFDEMETEGCSCGKKRCHGVCLDPGRPEKPKREKPGDVNRGDCPPLRYEMSDCQRAGNPFAVHRFAKCSVDGKYSSWFVGGGAAFFRGRCRKPSEGTWGLDYSGLFGRANVWLNYTRDREQGGEGAYQTDGEPEFVSRVHGFLGLGH